MAATCPVCSGSRRKAFNAIVLRRHRVDYFLCDFCGLLQTEKPYWLGATYSEAIAAADTGLVVRNIEVARRLTAPLFFLFERNARYLDVAGGTGLLTRMMRDVGFDFYWHDPYCRNIHAIGFEFRSAHLPYEAVTAFEVLEHVEDPLAFISEAFRVSGSDTLIFATELYAGQPPTPGEWWYYAHETGQHISFYTRITLQQIARRLGLRLFTHANFHMITTRKMSLLAFRLLAGRAGFMLAPVLRRLMPSKTFADHSAMLAQSADVDKQKS